MSRLVILSGTAQFNPIIGDIANYEKTIADAFNNQGWDIVNIRTSKPVVFSNGVNVTIEANVNDNYSGEDARRSAEQTLTSIPYGWLYGGTLFSGASLRILSDGQPQITDKDSTLDTTLTKLLGLGEKTILETVKGTTSNIGTPIAIAAVLIVALFIIKK